MSIEPIDGIEPASVVDGPWWPSAVRSVSRTEEIMAAMPAERDFRAEALGIAQHGTAFIPTPVMPSWQDLRRKRR